MGKKDFNRNWNKGLRWFLVVGLPILGVALALVISIPSLKERINSINRIPDNLVMTPPEDGFVKKANDFIKYLLTEPSLQNPSNSNKSTLSELNHRYKALEFALPYDEDAIASREDIRLVRIYPDSIHDEKLLEFYYNSNLPLLLARQQQQLDNKFFTIATNATDPIEIKSIQVIKSMFRVALKKDPWSGNIHVAENSLFENKDCIWLTFGKTTIPLLIATRQATSVSLFADLQKGIIKDRLYNHEPIDYYSYYQNAFFGNSININIVKGTEPKGSLQIRYGRQLQGEDTLKVITLQPDPMPHSPMDIQCVVYAKGRTPKTIELSQHFKRNATNVPFVDGMKLIVWKTQEHEKLAEFTFSEKDHSLLLSSLVKSNEGLRRYYIDETETDMFTQQILHALSSNLSNSEFSDNIQLSIDPKLSRAFESEIKNYIDSLKNHIVKEPHEKWDISLTIMDIATGQIIASPFYTEYNQNLTNRLAYTRKNTALVRRSIGSTFKPLLTLAAVLTKPSLLRLNTSGKYHLLKEESNKAIFFNQKTSAWALNGNWAGGTDMKSFLSKSDDIYPVALAALCLNGYPSDNMNNIQDIGPQMGRRESLFRSSNSNKNHITFKSWSDDGNKPRQMELFRMLDALYDLDAYSEDYTDSLRMYNYLWQNLHAKLNTKESFGLDEIIPDATIMNYTDFISSDGEVKTLRGNLVPWVLGQGNNQWNCVKMAEAWSRMLGMKRVKASLVVPDDIASSTDSLSLPSQLLDEVRRLKNDLNLNVSRKSLRDTWNSFLDIYHQAQNGGTLKALNTEMGKLNQFLHSHHILDNNDSIYQFAKTGTPNEYQGRHEIRPLKGEPYYVDIGMFCVGFMKKSVFEEMKNGGDGHGVVCILRITRTYPKAGSSNGLWGSNAEDFFNKRRLVKLYNMTSKFF